MNDLEIFANKFKNWRGNKRYLRYPKVFWEEIRQLAKNYPLSTISQILGISLPYLRQKILKAPDSIKFATLNLSLSTLPIFIEFIDQNAHPITVRFQANVEQLTTLIMALSGKMQ